MSFRRGHLKYFVTVAQDGQMTRAARRLGVAQPALSHAIAELEAELGIALLERHPRGVTLTDAGAAFLGKAQAVLEAEQAARLTARELSRAANSCLDIGFVAAPPVAIVPALMERFTELHPTIEVAPVELPFPYGTTAAWLESVDCAICFSPGPHPRVETLGLWSEPRALLAPVTHPLAGRSEVRVEEIIDDVFYGYGADAEPGWSGMWRLNDHRGGPPERMTDDSPSNALELVATIASAQALIVLASETAATIESVLRNVVRIPLVDAEPAVQSLVWRTDSPNSSRELLLEIAAEMGESSRHHG